MSNKTPFRTHCVVCGLPFHTMYEAKLHYTLKHTYKAYAYPNVQFA